MFKTFLCPKRPQKTAAVVMEDKQRQIEEGKQVTAEGNGEGRTKGRKKWVETGKKTERVKGQVRQV